MLFSLTGSAHRARWRYMEREREGEREGEWAGEFVKEVRQAAKVD